MADKQYDIPLKVQRLFEEKQKIREKLRQYFMARITSPHPDFKLQNDPAIDRYNAMITYRAEHYKLNAKNGMTVFIGLFLPIAGTIWLHFYDHNKKEKLLRSGKVAYKDRMWKTII